MAEKKLAKKLAKMSEEERALFLEQQRVAEEEMQRKKEEMLSRFLKVDSEISALNIPLRCKLLSDPTIHVLYFYASSNSGIAQRAPVLQLNNGPTTYHIIIITDLHVLSMTRLK